MGTPVRVKIAPRDRFVKKSAPKFTAEVFFVRDIQPSIPLKYLLSDKSGQRIPGSFYARELELAEVNFAKNLRVAQVVRQRKDKSMGQTEFLVTFTSEPSESHWVSSRELQRLSGPLTINSNE